MAVSLDIKSTNRLKPARELTICTVLRYPIQHVASYLYDGIEIPSNYHSVSRVIRVKRHM